MPGPVATQGPQEVRFPFNLLGISPTGENLQTRGAVSRKEHEHDGNDLPSVWRSQLARCCEEHGQRGGGVRGDKVTRRQKAIKTSPRMRGTSQGTWDGSDRRESGNL